MNSVPRRPIRAILFDLGNVLIDFDHTLAAKRLAPLCDRSVEEIFQLFFSSDITIRFEKGELSPRDFFAAVQALLGARMSYEEFLPIWNGIFSFSPQNEQVYALIKLLKRTYPVALLSNVNVLHWEYVKATFPVLGPFDRLFTSWELGAVKPDPLCYRAVSQALAVPLEQIFYTDDRVDLIDAAGNMGVYARVFTDVARLKEDLREAGVSIA